MSVPPPHWVHLARQTPRIPPPVEGGGRDCLRLRNVPAMAGTLRELGPGCLNPVPPVHDINHPGHTVAWRIPVGTGRLNAVTRLPVALGIRECHGHGRWRLCPSEDPPPKWLVARANRRLYLPLTPNVGPERSVPFCGHPCNTGLDVFTAELIGDTLQHEWQGKG